MATDILEEARRELAPELVLAPPEPGSAPVAPGTALTEEALDVAMYDRLQRAKQPSTAPGFTRNGITMTAEQIGAVSVAAEKEALRAYKVRRIARGEQPFQYLPGAKTKQDNAAFREQLPFFGTMFAGPDKFTEAFPADQRQTVEDRFADSFQPAAEKMATANKLFFETMTGQEVDDELWPAQRSAFARERLGYEGASRMVAGGDPSIATAVVDDATFYQLAGAKLTEQQTEVDTTRKVAEITRAHAIRGQSLGDAIAAAKEAAGPDWKKYEPAAREGYAGVLTDFDNRTITAANKLFDFAKKAEGMVASELSFEDGQAVAMAAYGMADQATRDEMMSIVGTRAEAEGTTVENYFARLAAGVGGGTNSFARQLASGSTRREAEDIRRLLKGNKPPTSTEGLTRAEDYLTALTAGPQGTRDGTAKEAAADPLSRAMSPEERKEWEARAVMLEGYSAFLTDTETAGIKVRRYLDNKREGFWDTLADTTVMMGESLPVMAAAMVPYGGGILLAGNGYAEKNLSTLRREAPDADPETLKAAAFTSGFIEAGIDRLQILTLGARMPKLNAALLKYGKPGLAGVIAVQALTKGSAEFGQEIAQDLTLPQIQEFASALAEDIPGPDWQAVLQREQEALGDIARVSFGFGLIGGAGSTITNYIEAGKVRETLQDRAGMELAGYHPVTANNIADTAETNPAAAAEMLKAAMLETTPEQRAANSQAAVTKLEAEALMTTGNQDAGLPVLEKLDDGRVQISYPDRAAEIVAGPEEALESVRGWEQEADVSVTQANRQMIGYLEDYHHSSPDTAFKGEQTGKKVTLADWAGESRERTAQAHARVQIMLRQAGQDMGGIDLSQIPILGSSQNQQARGITSIVAKINDGGNPLTVIEEHAEGVAKWLMESSRVPEAKMIGWIRETEQKLGKPLLSDNLLSLDPAARAQEIVEAWSYLAQANAAGRVADSTLPRAVKSFFRAFKEFIHTALRIIADLARLRGEGALDPELTYWLDVAAGINEEFETENLNREMEADLEREAMAGLPEIRQQLAGVLPHPDTPRVMFPGELRAIYDGIKNDPASGASPAARTRKANEFFLPFGESADLDDIRTDANEKGFNFATPAEMLEALDLSVNFGKPQYGGLTPDMDPGTSFGITLPTDPLLAAIAARIQAPEKNAEVFQKMRDRVREVKARFEAARLSAEFNTDDKFDKVRFEQARDIAVLEAVARSLPPELRGKLTGSFRKISDLRTTRARGEYIQSLIPKIEATLEKHLAGQFRTAIRREMDRGAVKVSEARTRGGKIGAAGHAIFEQARKAMTFTPGEAEVIAEKLTNQIEAAGPMTMERLEELDGMRAATELFADYENADSVRLEEALQLLKGVYAEGRKEWLDVLMARRDLRESRVRQLRAGLGLVTVDDAGGQTPTYISRPDRSRAKRKGEKTPNAASEAIMAAMLSGSQTLRRLGELSDDSTVAALVEEIEQAFATAENVESDRNAADNIALAAALRSILKVSTEYGLAKRLRELSDGSKDAPVDTVEGFKEEDVKVPKTIIDSILRREVSGFTDPKGNRIELDETDIAALEKAWDQFQELDDAKQSARRTVTFTRRTAKGSRVGLGPVSMLEGLQLWLTMRQPDQATKLEAMGYDAATLSQLEAWLPAEVQQLGLWMVDHIGKDAFTVDSLHRQEKGVGLPLVDNYFPVRNNVSRSDNTGAALDGQPPQQSGRNVSFIKERVVNRAEPALVNALAVFLAHRAQSNFWMSHVTAIREWGGVLKDESMADAIRVRMGEKYYQSLQQLMKRIESGGSLAAGQVNDFERVVKRMMKSFSQGTLGLRVSTLLVNTTAALNATFEVPAGTLLRGMMEVVKRPATFKDAWQSPAIQRRIRDGATFEATLAKSSGPSKIPLLALLESLGEKGVAPINYIDTGANTIAAAAVWEHTKNAALRAGLSADAAKAAADQKVEVVLRRTAQPTGRLARSEIEQRALDHPLSAMMALFISEPRKNFALTYMAARELVTGKGTYGKAMAAQQLAMGLVVYAAVEFSIRSFYAAWAGAKDDEEDTVWERYKARMTDPKAWGMKLTTGHLTGVPVYGQGWAAGMAVAFDQPVFDSSPNPLFKAMDSLPKLGTAMGKDDDEGNDPESTERIDGVIKAAQGLGSVLPGGALVAQLGNLADFAEGIVETDAEKLARYKSRFRKFEKDLPKSGDDKAIQQQNRLLRADWLKGELAPLTPERRKQVIEAIDPPKTLRALLPD